MNFLEAVKAGYRNYVRFQGRSSRSEYWWWALYQLVVNVVIGLIFGGGTAETGAGSVSFVYQGGIVANLWALAHLLPGLSVGVRRLYDINRSGWWLLIGLIPFLGALVLFIFYLLDGTPGPNTYGPDPKGRGVEGAAA